MTSTALPETSNANWVAVRILKNKTSSSVVIVVEDERWERGERREESGVVGVFGRKES